MSHDDSNLRMHVTRGSCPSTLFLDRNRGSNHHRGDADVICLFEKIRQCHKAKSRQLGNFRLDQVVGVGGMGVVLLARDIVLDRQVAIKFVRPSLMHDPEFAERFLREARLLASVEHENVVSIYATDQFEGIPFLVMPFLRGATLDKVPKLTGSTRTEFAIEVALETARGLAAIHKLNVIHRDIKPGNIWCEQSGKIKVVDFGLALDENQVARLTSLGLFLGSPAFCSPEQSVCWPLDHRTDLFSLGATIYHLFEGDSPFARETQLATLNAIRGYSPPSLVELGHPVSDEFSQLLAELLEKLPENRPATADEVVERLERIVRQSDRTPTVIEADSANEPSLVPRSPPKPPGSHPRMNRIAITIGMMGVALIIAGSIAISSRAQIWKTTSEPTPQSNDKADEDGQLHVVASTDSPDNSVAHESDHDPYDTHERVTTNRIEFAQSDSVDGIPIVNQTEREGEQDVPVAFPDQFQHEFGMTFVKVSIEASFLDESIPIESDRDYAVYFSAYETTERQYWLVMGKLPRDYSLAESQQNSPVSVSSNLPVRGVRWNDAVEFGRLLNLRQSSLEFDYHFRLPSVNEFQACMLCRAAWDMQPIVIETPASEFGNFGHRESNVLPVGCFRPNDWGLFDLHGNVWEWTIDWVEETSFHQLVEANERHTFKVFCGGSWEDAAPYCRADSGETFAPNQAPNRDVGFRLICIMTRNERRTE